MIRLAIAALAIVGLFSLFTGGASGAAAGSGFLVLFPLLILAKILFVAMLFGFFGRGFARRGPYRPPWAWRDRGESTRDERSAREDDFEEWHRMAHARKEVDGWVEDVE